MSCDENIHLDLCVHETRALLRAAEFLADLFAEHRCDRSPDALHSVLPLDSAILKLHVLMVGEGVPE